MNRAINHKRNPKGMGTVELAASAFALLIMVLISVDIGVLLIGNQTLDRAARDAARAAAAQSTLATAVQAAQAALKMHQTDGTFISQPVLTGTTSPDFVYQDNGGVPFSQLPAGSLNATVTVTSTLSVMLPASFGCMGVSTRQGAWGTGHMTFNRTYTFPIVRQSLSTNYGGNAP